MAVKLKKVAKRQIVTLAEGRKLGKPADILVDPDRHVVAFLVVTAGAVPETSVVVGAGDVQSFESDTLAIQSLSSLEVAAADDAALALLHNGLRLRGQPVLGAGGMKLGRISRVLVDERGNVVEYRVRKRPFGFFRPSLKLSPEALRTSGGEMAVVAGPAVEPKDAEKQED